MNTAFVLFKCEPQRELEVYLALLEIDSVTETHVAYGEYDPVSYTHLTLPTRLSV